MISSLRKLPDRSSNGIRPRIERADVDNPLTMDNQSVIKTELISKDHISYKHVLVRVIESNI